MNQQAKRYIGYLEHRTNDLLWNYRANIGKGYCTIFAQIIQEKYRWRNFTGMPWCAIFVHAVCIETYGVSKAKLLLGKPHPGTKVLARRLKRAGRLMDKTYIPNSGDLIFLHNGNGNVSHCGIVDRVEKEMVISIEGNTNDPSGHFPLGQGGAVAICRRSLFDNAILFYGKIK